VQLCGCATIGYNCCLSREKNKKQISCTAQIAGFTCQ
jgi:hypothetical protein